jgi:hypothetical protein
MPKRKKPDKDDRSLIEISNDAGDHWVADIPTSGVKETEKALRKAGLRRDIDEHLTQVYRADRIIEQRDPSQYRYHSDRVIDEDEDLEDNGDLEDDWF